jgi:hypothetical protein
MFCFFYAYVFKINFHLIDVINSYYIDSMNREILIQFNNMKNIVTIFYFIPDNRPSRPCPYCGKQIKHLVQLLRLTHGMNKEERRDLCYTQRKRKVCSKDAIVSKCPSPLCKNPEPFPQLHLHVKRKHNLLPSDEIYQKYVCKKNR